MNTALEYSTRVVQEGDRRCKKSTLNDLVHLTPRRIPLMNPPYGYQIFRYGRYLLRCCLHFRRDLAFCGHFRHERQVVLLRYLAFGQLLITRGAVPQNPTTATKDKVGEKKFCPTVVVFVVTTMTKLKIYLFLNRYGTATILSQFKKSESTFSPLALTNIGLGSGIRKQTIPDPRSRGRKGTGSWIKIRKTGKVYRLLRYVLFRQSF
jgi:hypothetical protein